MDFTFLNPAECWANVRRSGYPVLKSPVEYGFEQYLTMVRKFQYVSVILLLSLRIIKITMKKLYKEWEVRIAGILMFGGIL